MLETKEKTKNARIKYESFRFRNESLAIINIANSIISEFQDQGYDLTLRQLYYQFVARDLLPQGWIDPITGSANNEKSYGKIGSIVNRGRLAGLIDWTSIVDRTRISKHNPHWKGPEEIIQAAADSFALDSRTTQDIYIEVWVEKDALVGVVSQICEELDVPYLSCRGYTSQSAMWLASQRFLDKEAEGKKTILLHLGDHDPSGINMTTDIQNRLELFESNVNIRRIALNMDQIREYNPPVNPAKVTDSRYQFYITNYGEECWELDALDPTTISEIIRRNITEHTNNEGRQKIISKQEMHRERLQHIADNWEDLFEERVPGL